jgi:murein DD-endopeptidase MepM/ murein hydrolase activator NlpD
MVLIVAIVIAVMVFTLSTTNQEATEIIRLYLESGQSMVRRNTQVTVNPTTLALLYGWDPDTARPGATPHILTPGLGGSAARFGPVLLDWDQAQSGALQGAFGGREHPLCKCKVNHTGIDFTFSTGNTVGRYAIAAADGKVHHKNASSTVGGELHIIHEAAGEPTVIAVYMHLNYSSLSALTVGQTVTKGQPLGTIAAAPPPGGTMDPTIHMGHSSTGPHLHMEFRTTQGQAIDPLSIWEASFIPRRRDARDVDYFNNPWFGPTELERVGNCSRSNHNPANARVLGGL